MISYFRSILPSRLFLLVLLFLGLQLPLLLLNLPPTVPELLHMLVGERMAAGFAMYSQIYDNTAPLSAFVYWLLDGLVGRSFLTYRLVAVFLLLLQALLFNVTLNRFSVYAGKNYLPALVYLVVASLTFELNLLTPMLIGNTFVILSLPYIITISREGFDNNRLFLGGFMLGLAALSYLPLALLLVVGFFAVVFFASSTFRSFLLMLCGFVFPYAVLMTYYLYTGALNKFLELHLLYPWQFRIEFVIAPTDLAKLMALPALLLFLSLISILSLPQRLVFQVKFQQVMWVWLVMALILVFTRTEISGSTFILLFPPLAYFSEYFFTSDLKKWVLNLCFVMLLAGVLVLRYKQLFNINRLVKIDETALLLPPAPPSAIQDARVLVLGNDISYYYRNTPATPYLNWPIAQQHFGNLSEYQPLFDIYQNLRAEQPTYIVDKAGLMPELTYKLPSIFGRYTAAGPHNIYQLTR